MRRMQSLITVVILFCFCGAADAQIKQKTPEPKRPTGPMILLVDPQNHSIEAPAIGNNLMVSASGLVPGRLYDIYLRDQAGLYVSMLRLTSDGAGTLPPAVLWYQSGVVGCSSGTETHLKQPYRFRTFEEAETKLANAAFVLELRDREQLVARRAIRLGANKQPVVYPSDANGCLLNASDGSDDIYVAGRNFLPGTIAEIYLVPHQGDWQAGDRIQEVRRWKEPHTVRLTGAQTSFVAPLWGHGEALVGAYDVIARPFQTGSDRALARFVHPSDVIGWRGDVGIVIFDPSHTHLVEQIAGQKILGYPWFKHVDGFALGTDVWGALDPKRKPMGHQGTYAAWYVVVHQNQWTTSDPLVDVSGGYEITPIKPGCINSTETLLWSSPMPANVNDVTPTRPYDVVIDFGVLPAMLGIFQSDGVYTEGTDFVDYYGTPGFYLVRDPRLPGSFQTADAEFSFGCTTDLDGITITWSDPAFYGASIFNVAIGDDDMGSGVDATGRCPMNPGNVDMRAHAYYPKKPGTMEVANGGPFPVVIFYHGQQLWGIPGYLGYDYLGNLLASHGFIVYSVDGRSLLDSTMASRGEHIRAHMRRLVGQNAMGSGSLFEQKLDLQNVALVGHSRGGESVVAAWEWQRVQPDAGYAFKAVISIAPVQKFNVWPQEPPFLQHMRNIPYMIIHGSKDGDVADFQGLRLYDRAADIRQPGQTPKAMVFVKDANHNFFNTIWETQEGDDYGAGGVLSAAEQQGTAKVFIHAFVEAYQKNRPEYLHFFTGVVPYPGNAAIATDFQAPAADYLAIDSHEVIPPAVHDKNSNSANGAVGVNSLPDYDERLLAAGTQAPWSTYPGETYAAALSWDAPADTYTTDIPPALSAALNPTVQTHLSFRVGQVFRQVNSPNPPGMNQDFAVRLKDANGNFSPWVYLRDFGPIYPIWDSQAWAGKKTVMSVVRIPLQVFTVNTASQIDLTKLSRIEFDFFGWPTGEIVFDDIRFTK